MQSINYAQAFGLRDPVVLHLPGRMRKSRRILQVVGSMDRGGIETWLMHVLRHINRDQFEIDFLVHTSQPGAYDQEIQALGSHVIPCLSPNRPWQYAQNFRQIIQEYGPYDVVHSHVHQFSGFILRLARSVDVPCRIAHSHLDASQVEIQANWQRQLYLRLMQHWVKRHATHGLGASRIAAADLFSPTWVADRRWQIHYCSIDLAPFYQVPKQDLRQQLQLSPQTPILGHVGRLTPQKNHRFLIQVIAAAMGARADFHLVLIGTGELEAEIQQQIAQTGWGDRIHLLGSRQDVPSLLRQMNGFFFPSHYEGLPLTLIEAQAAGLPCLISDSISPEVDIIPQLIQRRSLNQSLQHWSETLLNLLDQPPAIAPGESLQQVAASPFNIRNSIQRLEALYLG